MRIPTKSEMMQGMQDFHPEFTLFYQTDLGGIEGVVSDITTSPKLLFRATRMTDGKRVTLDFKTYKAAVNFILEEV